jgi:hypothetical protein
MVFSLEQKKEGCTSHEISRGDFCDFQKGNRSLAQTAAWAGWNFNVTGDAPPAFLEGDRGSWNFFDALGVKPLLGRTFWREGRRARSVARSRYQ